MLKSNLTRDEARTRSDLLSVSHYQVNIDLSHVDNSDIATFGSTSTVSFSCRQPGESTFIDLIADSVNAVILNGTSLVLDDVVREGRVMLPSLAEENTLTIMANCAYSITGEGLHRFIDPVDNDTYIYTQFEAADARRAFACFDQPDLKATYAVTVTAPSSWHVVSAAPTPKPLPVNDKISRWIFSDSKKMSTYILAVVGGPYAETRGSWSAPDGREIPLGVYVRKSLAEHADPEVIMDITKKGFTFFEKAFDQPFPFDKYDQLFVPEFNFGAMENAGAVTFRDQYIFRSAVPDAARERRALTILHELAHMWFGNLVTMSWWDDLWLNESFAEWASTTAMAEATDWKDAWTTFAASEGSWALRADQLPTTHPVVADMVDLDAVAANFDGITYAKGASVLKQLVAWVGRDAFDQGLRNYFAKHAWGNTTLNDLLVELSATSGRDLSTWSQVWLERVGVNRLSLDLSVNDKGVITDAYVVQMASDEANTLRPHRLGIGCYRAINDARDAPIKRTEFFEIDVEGEKTKAKSLVGLRQPDLLLLNDNDLTYSTVRFDDTSLATIRAGLSRVDDSLARAVVWTNMWDMTRAGELPAATFVDLVLDHGVKPGDSASLMALLNQLASAVKYYVAPSQVAATRERIAERLWQQLSDAPKVATPGTSDKDWALQLTKAFAHHASAKAHADTVEKILSKEVELPYVELDTDLSWVMVQSLATAGRRDKAAIDKHLQTDNTAAGRLAALTAKAMIPTADAKRAAWDSVMDASRIPNAAHVAIATGFTHTHDVSLLRPYVDEYFSVIENFWASNTYEIASNFTVTMFPAALADKKLATRLQMFIKKTDRAPLIRLLRENLDGVERSLRARSRSHTVE